LAAVRRYDDPADIELAGLIAASLALGNATAITRAVEAVLRIFGGHPARALATMKDSALRSALSGFRYRFFDGEDVAALLCAARNMSARHGSLERAFLAVDDPAEEDYATTASRFVRSLASEASQPDPWRSNLFPDPARGSAAKRVFLYLRWMVRHDGVDPGPWQDADQRRLVIPLDTHMAAACRRLGLLSRHTTDLKAAREALAAFRIIRPDDPVRYDFCMTRPGIHPDLDPDKCFECFH
jgi:uncharacterized protein (TIGR02757 family)